MELFHAAVWAVVALREVGVNTRVGHGKRLVPVEDIASPLQDKRKLDARLLAEGIELGSGGQATTFISTVCRSEIEIVRLASGLLDAHVSELWRNCL